MKRYRLQPAQNVEAWGKEALKESINGEWALWKDVAPLIDALESIAGGYNETDEGDMLCAIAREALKGAKS